MSRPVLAILGFHKIGEPSAGNDQSWFYVPEATFAGQLTYLRDHDWTVLDLASVLRGLSDPALLPPRCALITFDDGYRSVLDVALPWLKQFGYPAVTFVATDFVGGVNAFDAEWEPKEAICDWDALRTLEKHGIAVQSHGVSHRRFSELSLEAQENELRESRRRIETELQRAVEVFAYPYGDPGTDADAVRRMMTRTGYRAACRFNRGPLQLPAADPYHLTRVPIGPDTDLEQALALASSPAGSRA